MKALSFILFSCLGLFSIAQAPSANFTISDSDNILCAGDCIFLVNNSTGDGLSYTWQFSGGTPSSYFGQNQVKFVSTRQALQARSKSP